MPTPIEHFQFSNLHELREWLNDFTVTDLHAAYPQDSDYISLAWITETLTDGSEVINFQITHV